MSIKKTTIKVAKEGIKNLKKGNILDKKTIENLLDIADIVSDFTDVPQEVETALSILGAIVTPNPVSIGMAVYDSVELLQKWADEQRIINKEIEDDLRNKMGYMNYENMKFVGRDKTYVKVKMGEFKGLPKLQEGEKVTDMGFIVPAPPKTGIPWINELVKKSEDENTDGPTKKPKPNNEPKPDNEVKPHNEVKKVSREIIDVINITAQKVNIQGVINYTTNSMTPNSSPSAPQVVPDPIPEVVPPQAKGLMMQPLSSDGEEAATSETKGLMMQPISAADHVPDSLEKIKAPIHPDEQKKIDAEERKAMKKKLDDTKKTFGGMAKAAESFYKISGEKGGAAFELYKAFSIAEAGVATYNGATQAMTLPFPVNFAVAASIVASGIANIAQISAMQPGKKASGSSSGAPGVSSASKMISDELDSVRKKEEEEKKQKQVNIIVNGDVVDPDDWFRRNAASINKAMQDGVFA